uniref:OCA domain-containing protein n=1 Tax=Mola mola TaxID=94237 RepID=A0A3Q3XGY1_MOLML
RFRCSCSRMGGRFKQAADETAQFEAGLSQLSGDPAAGSDGPGLPGPDAGGRRTGRTGSCGTSSGVLDSDRVYLGVRVKMPVRDLLRDIRLAQGWQPQESQVAFVSLVSFILLERPVRMLIFPHYKSLEELAIIVEVLEEDLRTGISSPMCSPPQSLTSVHPRVSPEWSPTGNSLGLDAHFWYNSDESDEMIPSPESHTTYSPGTAEYHQVPSPPGFLHSSPQLCRVRNTEQAAGRREAWFDAWNHDLNAHGSDFFWTQLQREDSHLKDISDAGLLNTDWHGRTVLHQAACVGRRALGYSIGKRMAALNSLDLKDSAGMTALLHAAKHNQHLMVADLIHLGADVNATNDSGKSCLHLSAEKGYVRVLEVLKQAMMDGLYVDVEATDNYGMTVLQCASVALKVTVRELESSNSPNQTRLHTLRQEQMMETLECLLQMGSYLHTMV